VIEELAMRHIVFFFTLNALVAKLWPEETDSIRVLDQPSVTKREMAQIPRWLQPVYLLMISKTVG